MIERGLATIAARFAADDAAGEVDWTAYQKCPVCKAELGQACRAMSGRIAGGRPDGKAWPLPHAHAARKRRAGR